MCVSLTSLISRLLAAALLTFTGTAQALTAADALLLATGDNDERIALMSQLSAGDDAQAHALIRALGEDRVRIQEETVLIANDEQAVDAVSGAPVRLTDMAEDASVNNRLRGGY